MKKIKKIKIKVNGKITTIVDKFTLAELVNKLNIPLRKVAIEMTLTSPNCPVAESLPNSVKDNILKIDGIKDVDLRLVWDPPWSKEKMSDAAKLELNL